MVNRAEAQRPAALAFGEEDATAKVLAGHVEERVRGLQPRHVDDFGAARREEVQDGGSEEG